MTRPNILILMADQHQQATLGCYSHPLVQTPHIDGIAARGTRFANAFCTSPLCGPSRVSWLTGTYPHTNGAWNHPNNRHRSGKGFKPQLSEGIESLVQNFRDAGWHTHGSGYMGYHVFDGDHDLDKDGERMGFASTGMRASDYEEKVGREVARRYNLGTIEGEMWEPSYDNVEGEAFPYAEELMWDRQIAADCTDFLQRHDGEQPFFLYCGFRAPHTPWCPSPSFHGRHDPAAIKLPDYRAQHHHIPRRLRERIEYFDIHYYPEELVRTSMAMYCDFVSWLDDCVGKVLQALEASGQADNTIIVYTADHGEMLYQHGLCEKQCFYEASIRVPLILSWPGQIPAGQSSDALVSLMDLMPTLMTACDVDVPEHVEGIDLSPTFTGNAGREQVFSEFYHNLDPCRMVRDHCYKYIHTEDDIDELYDLQHDPGELLNLAWYPQYAGLVEHYEQLVLADWEIPEVPLWSAWNDLNERKQKQRLAGMDIIDTRPPLPDWAKRGPA